MRYPSSGAARRGAGFTLIELLVVIAIIAILAAILFPVFAQAREKGRQAACLSNLKQIGSGLMMYTQDYDELLPATAFSPPGISANDIRQPKWADVIQPYVKNDRLFTCPSDSGTTRSFNSLSTTPNRGQGCSGGGCTGPLGGSYLTNNSYNAVGNPMGRSLAEIPVPADTIFAVEGPATTNNQFYWSNGAANPTLPLQPFADLGVVNGGENNSFRMSPGAAPPYFAYQESTGRRYLLFARHTGMANTLFCDGHAKGLTVTQIAETRPVGSRNVFWRWSIHED